MERNNIIFYFSDQQRWDTLGCYGQKLPVTPNLDHLAESGTRFKNAFTCQPVCGPARSCIQSGMYATETGCFTNARSLPENIKTIADYMNEDGYQTAYIGKWHLASDRDKNHYETASVPKERRGGYQYWMAADVLEFTSHGYNGYVYNGEGEKVDFIGYRADCINNLAIDYLHRVNHSRPFFLFISQLEPHHQNDHEKVECPDWAGKSFENFEIPGDLIETEGNWRENYADYLGCCQSLDHNVGSMIDTLKEQGLWENTVFIYASDHGCHFKTRNDDYKRTCHDASIHIPLIISGPGFYGGNVEEELVSLIDIPATLLDIAGIKKPDDYRGLSLLELMRKPCLSWREEVLIQISENYIGRAVRTADWKFSVKAEGDGWENPGSDLYYADLLYNLRIDPYEKNNLVYDCMNRSVKCNLAGKLKAEMVKCGDHVKAILDYNGTKLA